jgi:RNA polymerase sigma factor (sigma-70 family)
MSYREFADNQLVETLLTSASAQEKADVAAELFKRYCEKCDCRIRAVLQSRGLEYSDRNLYYNSVFFEVYERVFAPDSLIRKLQSYDPTRGVFARWLLRVVTSEIQDWLKRRDPETGLSHALSIFPDNLVSSDLDQNNHSTPRIDNVPSAPNRSPIHHAMSQLSDELRVTLRLRFLGYCNLESHDVAYLADLSSRPAEAIRSEIDRLRQDLNTSEAFHSAEQQELELAVLTERVEYFSHKAAEVELKLETLGYTHQEIEQGRAAIENEKADSILRYQDIKALQARLRTQYAARQIEAEKFAREMTFLDYQKVVKRWFRVQHKKELSLHSYRAGTHMTTLSYEQLADLLGCSSGTVSSRINRAKKRLADTLRISL